MQVGGRMDGRMDGQTGKLTAAYHNFINVPENNKIPQFLITIF